MEKRAILAIVLALLVVVVWQIMFAPSPPKPPPPAEYNVRETPQPAPETGAGLAQKPPPAEIATGESRQPLKPKQATEIEIHVDTGVAQFVLTSHGADVKTVQLLDYPTSLDEGAPPTKIEAVPDVSTKPLATVLKLDSRTLPLTDMAFVPSETTLVLSGIQPEGRIVFHGQSEDGIVAERVYRFRYRSYVFEVDTRIRGVQLPARSTMTVFWGPGLRQQHEQASRRRRVGTVARSYVSGKIFEEAPKQVGEIVEKPGEVTWAALADTYFAAVLIPGEPAANAVVVRRVSKEDLGIGIRTPLEGTQVAQMLRVYVGPKEQRLLEDTDPSLGKLIDLGFFSPLARPMMQLLRMIYRVVRNYGVAIILVTILIKAVFWPLTQKSYKSMQAMQKLQPKMKELQVLYKDDKQALNRAMMQLYREQKVNPMGGCLPMILQIPFFFAFYNALLYSIELRQAPFVCWQTELFWVGRGICDLSTYDPSYITPVLMGVTMFLQQKMTPTTGDPTQAKVMQFMPLIFLFFFLKAPAGLVIYWFTNNLLSIAQQLLINRTRHLETAKAKAASQG